MTAKVKEIPVADATKLTVVNADGKLRELMITYAQVHKYHQELNTEYQKMYKEIQAISGKKSKLLTEIRALLSPESGTGRTIIIGDTAFVVAPGGAVYVTPVTIVREPTISINFTRSIRT